MLTNVKRKLFFNYAKELKDENLIELISVGKNCGSRDDHDSDAVKAILKVSKSEQYQILCNILISMIRNLIVTTGQV